MRKSINLLIIFISGILINNAARAQWVPDGIPVCSSGKCSQYETVTDGACGVIVAWRDWRNDKPGIYAQRIDSNGVALWTPGGVAICTNGAPNDPQLVSDDHGGAIIIWEDYRSGDSYVYAQRVDEHGSVLWAVDGFAVCPFNWGPYDGQNACQIAHDGHGGAIITWVESRSSTELDRNIYAQRIDGEGALVWPSMGVSICAASGYQEYPQIAADGLGGATIVWMDQRSGSGYDYDMQDIYAQRINGNGLVLGTANGVAVCVADGYQAWPVLAADGLGGAIIAWSDLRSGSASGDIYARRIHSNCTVLWSTNGVAICTEIGFQSPRSLCSDGAGGVIIVWIDDRSGDSDIYAQRINEFGSVSWTANGTPVCSASSYQGNPGIIADGSGGGIVAWDDTRCEHPSDAFDVYAQRIDADGTALWAVDGEAISTADEDQERPALISDGSGGAVIVWADQRITLNDDSWDIYAHRVDNDGTTLVATLLQSMSAAFNGASIEISWLLSEIDEGRRFAVYRMEQPNGDFVKLDDAYIEREALRFTFVDVGWEPGSDYVYRVTYIEGDKESILFETNTVRTPEIPLSLYQNHPNPFNPTTTISYYLPFEDHVRLTVHDVSGRRIALLVDGIESKGRHSLTWSGIDGGGDSVSSGVYILRLKSGKACLYRKLVLIR